jgi:hypothetical protein
MRALNPLRLALIGTLAAFFLVFHRNVLRAQFGADEMMNLYGHWQPPLWKTGAALVGFWSKTVRPMGTVYYVPLYELFGLNPKPFNIVRTAILLANTVVFVFLAKWILRSWPLALLAAFPVAYQSELGNLHYEGAYIYDVLCGGFYFAALLYYVRCRRAGAILGAKQIAILLGIYICALDSKEMAVSFPVIIIAYELLVKGRRAQVLPAFFAALVTLVFIWGKTSGAGTLTSLDSYRPVFTWQRYMEANIRILNQLFYTEGFTTGRILLLWAVLLYVGLLNWGLRKFDPRWLFLAIWVTITPLPITFLPGRGRATLYIVSAGWAMLAALTVRAVLHRLARQPVAGLPRRAIVAAGFAVCIWLYWHETGRNDSKVVPYFLTSGEETRQVIVQMRAMGVRPPPNSNVVFLNSPFPKDWDTLFIAALVWKDPTINIWLKNKQPPPEVLRKAAYIFDYSDGRFSVAPADP